ncbi:unnamed protein product [Owenia fusiformis]|uniref:Uncharacterized protein n=1 Tax=Owenia fusiformis TaxID=6347 RepID=A0A8J1XN77_OWEFU|nr:unnamed protein product [Owenia fusiformis]
MQNSYSEWLTKTYVKEMSNTHTLQALSWRRLYLARAKLKAASRTSALLSGFAMVAMVEAQLDDNIPIGLLVTFSVCTTLLVAVHLLALMISTCILPNIEAVSNVHNVTAVNESPHDRLQIYIELAWIFSTGIGILLFLIQMGVLAWVRFYKFSNHEASIASTAIIVPAIIIFIIFAIHFYRQLIAHKYERSHKGLEELESMANELDGNGLASNPRDPLSQGNIETV